MVGCPGTKATGHSKPRDSLDRDKNLRDSPVTKITGQSGLGQIFAGLSRMIVPRDLWDREKKWRDCPVLSLAHPFY